MAQAVTEMLLSMPTANTKQEPIYPGEEIQALVQDKREPQAKSYFTIQMPNFGSAAEKESEYQKQIQKTVLIVGVSLFVLMIVGIVVLNTFKK